MMSPDLQRLQHIKEYCVAIGKTIARYGDSFEIYASDADFQRSVSFSILQIEELSGGLSAEYRQATATVDIPALLQFCEEQLSEK